MNFIYSNAASNIKNLSYKLNITINEDHDNNNVYIELGTLIKELENIRGIAGYLAKPTQEGILWANNGTRKFFIRFKNGKKSYDLELGSRLEIYLNEDKWYMGELSWGTVIINNINSVGFYFHGANTNLPLRIGMKVRIRI